MTEKYRENLQKTLQYIREHNHINFSHFGNYMWGAHQILDPWSLDMYAKCASNWLNRLTKHGFIESHRPQSDKQMFGWTFSVTDKGMRFLQLA